MPSVKTVRDKFRPLVLETKNAMEQDDGQSGIVEVVPDLAYLLDALKNEATERDIEKKVRKKDMNASEENHVAAGEESRGAATFCCTNGSEDTIVTVIEGNENFSTRKKARMGVFGMDEWQEMIK